MGRSGPMSSTGGRADGVEGLRGGRPGAALAAVASWEGLGSSPGDSGDPAGLGDPVFEPCEPAAGSNTGGKRFVLWSSVADSRRWPSFTPCSRFGVRTVLGRLSLGPVGPITGPGSAGDNGGADDCLDVETRGGTGDSTNPLHPDSGVCPEGAAGEWLSFPSSLGGPCTWVCEDSSGLLLWAGRFWGLVGGGSWPRATSIWQYTSTLGKITLLLGESR